MNGHGMAAAALTALVSAAARGQTAAPFEPATWDDDAPVAQFATYGSIDPPTTHHVYPALTSTEALVAPLIDAAMPDPDGDALVSKTAALPLFVLPGGLALYGDGPSPGVDAIDLATLAPRWSSSTLQPLAAGAGRLCGSVQSFGLRVALVCLDVATGAPAWSTTPAGADYANLGYALAIVGDVLYLHGATIEAYDLDTGAQLFSTPILPMGGGEPTRYWGVVGGRVLSLNWCPAQNTECVEAFDARTGGRVAGWAAPVGGMDGFTGPYVTWLWSSGSTTWFRALNPAGSPRQWSVVAYDGARDSFTDATAAFANLPGQAVLAGASEVRSDGTVVMMLGDGTLCSWDVAAGSQRWCSAQVTSLLAAYRDRIIGYNVHLGRWVSVDAATGAELSDAVPVLVWDRYAFLVGSLATWMFQLQ